MNRFKVGDEVVVITNAFKAIPAGTVLTIMGYNEFSNKYVTTSLPLIDINSIFYSNELVLKSIYESPLYQVLRESEDN